MMHALYLEVVSAFCSGKTIPWCRSRRASRKQEQYRRPRGYENRPTESIVAEHLLFVLGHQVRNSRYNSSMRQSPCVWISRRKLQSRQPNSQAARSNASTTILLNPSVGRPQKGVPVNRFETAAVSIRAWLLKQAPTPYKEKKR